MRLAPDLVLTPDGWQTGRVVSVADGRIGEVEPLPSRPDRDDETVRLTGKALLPGTVNAHCHSFQSLLRGLGDDLDFMAWRDRVLYPYSTRLDRDGICLGAAFAFAEMLLHGVTTCGDFFSLQDRGNDNARAVILSHQAVTDVWVHGRHVVRDRRPATADQDRLLARVRELTRDWRPA